MDTSLAQLSKQAHIAASSCYFAPKKEWLQIIPQDPLLEFTAGAKMEFTR